MGAIVSRAGSAALGRTLRGASVSGAAEAIACSAPRLRYRAAEAQASNRTPTGLLNRRYSRSSSSPAKALAADAVGNLMVDIDKFKVLNDTHGDANGDEVLRAVASAHRRRCAKTTSGAVWVEELWLLRNPTRRRDRSRRAIRRGPWP